MKRIILPATLSVMLLLILAACSQNPVGIFASVARERLILDDRALANDLTVGSVTRAGDRYFMASGLLRFRDVDNPASLADGNPEEWSAIPAPGTDADNYTTTSVVTFGGDVYATFARQDSNVSGVYRVTNPTSATPGISSPVFDTTAADVGAVGELFVVNDGTERLLVSVKTEDPGAEYVLYYSDDGSAFAVVPGTDGANASGSAWTDAASDGTDLVYLSSAKALVDLDGIGAGDDAQTFAAAGGRNEPGKDGAAAYRAAHYDGSTLWLSDSRGHLYSTTDFGGSWTRNASAYSYDVDPDEAIAFTDFATISTSGSTDVTVVGTEDAGYYLLGATAAVAPSSPSVDGSNYRESELSGLAINTFYADNANLRTDYPVPTAAGDPYELIDGYLLFAGTANGGLWRALFYDGAIQWVRE